MKTHLKDPTAYGQTYSCSICDKVFSGADNRKRHEATHSYSLTCGVCGQYFNRLDNLARHRAQHERPEAKQRPPMVAPEPGPVTKLRRIVSLPPRTPMENPVGPDVLPVDGYVKEIYEYTSIRVPGMLLARMRKARRWNNGTREPRRRCSTSRTMAMQ
jgi:hypothetical protein